MMPSSGPTGSRPTVETLPLPHRLFLLSLQEEKGRLDADSEPVRGSLLSAAAVAELRIAGLLHDRGGKAGRTNTPAPATIDPFLAQVLGDVPPDQPRSWFDVLESRWDKAERFVQEQLAGAGHITIEHHQVFGPIRRKKIVTVDPAQVQALRSRIRDAVRTDSAPASVSLGDAVLTTLAVDGLVGTMFRWRELRTHKPAIRALADRVEQELPGLRKALSYSIALRRSA
ncbi:GPP34 family phosphoprotein [Actinoplanes sp. M2I2]|uniref:GOLPH3/VPS74 family protein n=1 Tax=Actinoplanes sp. M2I2 TaxID=1734444 RepID=UPI00202123D1|nr:GPP34 family phosphoprotein [Actinoplanes sp. M2I2]